ncbi:alpha-tocopherol transfer protein-like [Ischnura elegans]|uniref:alpha-tocopherol transfer protein-like n=1 Tax=Ischnura elegans TaxID=197161 RepID=UPI001ED87C98|nr:alpha-tocopherol transfer protein-like [Ischnura elegans]XP_046386943.1 alpha-tocopherol transfer protein-like [Ischnura elegans]
MAPLPPPATQNRDPNPRFPFIDGADGAAAATCRPEDVQIIRIWMKRQPHLPTISDAFISLFLHSVYNSIEQAKATIETYFSARTAAPEFFKDRNGFSEDVQFSYKTAHFTSLNKKTPEGYRVLICRLADFDPSHLHFNDVLRAFFMFADICISEDGVIPGYITIFDLKGVVLGHLPKISLPSLKKFMIYIQDAHPVRLKAVHLINCVPFMDKILAMVKPLMKNEMINLLQLHSNGLDNLFKTIPQEIMPEDYGGKDKTMAELHADYKKLMETKYLDWMKEEEEHLRTNEDLRIGSKSTSSELFGMEGSFRKLAID